MGKCRLELAASFLGKDGILFGESPPIIDDKGFELNFRITLDSFSSGLRSTFNIVRSQPIEDYRDCIIVFPKIRCQYSKNSKWDCLPEQYEDVYTDDSRVYKNQRFIQRTKSSNFLWERHCF